MIGTIVQYITAQLDELLQLRLRKSTDQSLVLLSGTSDENLTDAGRIQNVIRLSMVNMQEANLANANYSSLVGKNASFSQITHPLFLNLKLLIYADFDTKRTEYGLNLLGMIMAYLQGKPSWNSQNSPNLPSLMDRIIFELVSLNLHEQSHLWSHLGSTYKPYALYKLKMISLDSGLLDGFTPNVSQTENN